MAEERRVYQDTTIPLGGEPELMKRSFFHQFIGFQISKNPHLLLFAKQNLVSTRPRCIYRVEFGEPGEWFITYEQDEDPVRYETVLSSQLVINDVSWSTKYNCYFDYIKGAPFVVDADIITLLYLSSLQDTSLDILGEWLRSATRGRYNGFNPVHLYG